MPRRMPWYEFLAGRGGSRIGRDGRRAVLVELAAMYAPELCLHRAVTSLEPAGPR